MDTVYQDEKNKILNTLFYNLWFKHWKNDNVSGLVNRKEYTIELYVTSSCNQNCEYCYLQKYKELYPAEYNKPELILKNLRLFFDWLLENKYVNFRNIDIYSGEIHGYKLGNDVYDIILEYLDKGLIINQITVPTNGSWLLNDNTCKKVEEYIAKFKAHNTRLCYSFSIDGAVIDKLCRPLKTAEDENKRTDAFYDKMFHIALKYNFCWHPMLASNEAKYWVENLNWWFDTCKKYGIDFGSHVAILEVRNNDWTKETLHELTKVYDAQLDYYIKTNYTNSDGSINLDGLARFIFNRAGKDISMNLGFMNTGSHIGCTSPQNFTVRLGDLAICSCHRTAYDPLLYGKFTVANNKITGIKANNVEMAIKALCSDVRTSLIGCDTCDFKDHCYFPCFGSSKEYTNDPFTLEPKVCKIMQVKAYHLIKRLDALGTFTAYKRLVDTCELYSKKQYEEIISYKNKVLSHKELEIYE